MAGLAQGGAVSRALAAEGIRFAAHRWVWAPGLRDGIFEPHRRRDNSVVFNQAGWVGDNADEYGALPGEGVNAKYCCCSTRILLRGADGRFLREVDSKPTGRQRARRRQRTSTTEK